MPLVNLTTTVTVANDSSPIIRVADMTGLAPGTKIVIISEHGYDEVGLDGVFTIAKYDNYYYFGTGIDVGRSFEATISTINGSDITLNRNATAACVGKQLVIDSTDDIEALIESGGSWSPYEDQTYFITRSLLPLLADNSEQTFDFKNVEWKSPRGCFCAVFIPQLATGGRPSNKIYKNFRLTGNVADGGYGPTYQSTMYQNLSQSVVLAGTDNIIEDCTVKDVWMSLGFSYAVDCVFQNCTLLRTAQLREYIQWDALPDHSTRCVFHNVNYESVYAAPVFEAYQSNGTVYYQCAGQNANFSVNSSGRTRYIDCSTDWDWVSDGGRSVQSPSTPLFNISRVQEEQQGAQTTGTEGGCFVLRFNTRIRNAMYPDKRIMQHYVTGKGIRGIDTDGRVYDGTYVCDVIDGQTGSAFFGYYMLSAYQDVVVLGGHHSVTQLTGISVNKCTLWDFDTNGWVVTEVP
jgi:hypothetical protein